MSDPTVTTRSGPVRGCPDDAVHSYLGIPYAAAPTGALRFRPPRPVAPWTDVRDALDAGPAALQNPTVLETDRGWSGACGEDCLYLNVWTPAPDRRVGPSLPVLVWIHGGSFVNGSGSLGWYDGKRLAARGDVVVVTLNYRLGPFGYLDLSALGGEDLRSSGNAGLLDQVAALQWVRDNIEVFGGDAQRVCVVGESAGAMSVGTLLAAEPARGLVAAAVMQSGTPVGSTAVESREVAEETFGVLDLQWNAAGLAQLLRLPASDVLSAGDQVTQRRYAAAYSGDTGSSFCWQPVVDGITLLRDPWEATAAGAAADVPVLIGTNGDEMRIMRVLAPGLPAIDESELLARLGHLGTADPGAVAARYRAADPASDADDLWYSVLSDRIFGAPTARYIDARAQAGAPTWSYRFAWRSPVDDGFYGSSHTFEIPFVFDNFDAPGVAGVMGPATEETRSLSALMQDTWVRFARTGDPAGPAQGDWKRCGSERTTMVFDTVSGVGPDPLAAL